MPIAEYLIGSLNDRRYLPVRLCEVAFELDVSEDRVKQDHRCAPRPGARRHRHAQPPPMPAASDRATRRAQARRSRMQVKIVSRYLTELGEHKFTLIARESQIPQVVCEAWEFIKRSFQ